MAAYSPTNSSISGGIVRSVSREREQCGAHRGDATENTDETNRKKMPTVPKPTQPELKCIAFAAIFTLLISTVPSFPSRKEKAVTRLVM